MSLETTRDDWLTLAAIGALAYIGETLTHEALGHGGVCIAMGGRITALAPLFMRCSVDSLWTVLAGPAANMAAAALFATLVVWRGCLDRLGLFLWLSAAFNFLVACGYLVVGATTGFGDWAVLLNFTKLAWIWRATVGVLGLGGYALGLLLMAVLYGRFGGPDRLRMRTLIPGSAAGAVAVAAEVYGGRAAVSSILIALGCTLFVGWSLSRIGRFRAILASEALSPPLERSFPWALAAIAAAASFVLWVGPAAAPG